MTMVIQETLTVTTGENYNSLQLDLQIQLFFSWYSVKAQYVLNCNTDIIFQQLIVAGIALKPDLVHRVFNKL